MYYQFIPPYLNDADFTLHTDKIIDENLHFLERKPRLKLKYSIHKPTNVFFTRNVNWDNFEFVVCPYREGEDDCSKRCPVYTSISHKDKRIEVLNIQEQTPFFSNLSLNGEIVTTKPVFKNKGIFYQSYECTLPRALDEQAFLNEQLYWTFQNDAAAGKGSGCVLDKICKSLSRYNDFYGLFCCYDGNKKIQLHTEWDSKCLSPDKFANPYVKDDKSVEYEPIELSLMSYWEIIGQHIKEVIAEERGVAVDFNTILRNPLSVRRLNWGMRRVDTLGEFFNIGDKVPQIELYANSKHSLYDHLNSKGPLHRPIKRR